MEYVAIRYFEDTLDNNTAYDIGTIYPRKGFDVSDDRIKELSTSINKMGVPVIVKLKELDEKISDEDNIKGSSDNETGGISEDNTQDLSVMKIEELKKIADDKNISYPKNIKKAELIELLINQNIKI